MTDKNGTEIRTGDIVEIKGGYFKGDNGLYFVDRSPGDPYWFGTDHCLTKIEKTGKISTARSNIGFWPIVVTLNDWMKKAEAKEYNKRNTSIEIRTDISNQFVIEELSRERKEYQECVSDESRKHGNDYSLVKGYTKVVDFFAKSN